MSMETLRLIPGEPAAPAPAETGAVTQEIIGSVTQEIAPSTPPPERAQWRRPGEVQIRLESLRTRMRAVVREHSKDCLRIEAELPWLAIGTVLHADNADGVEQTARVQSFEVDVTSAGSARLLIFATTRPGSQPAQPPSRQRTRSRLRSRVLVGLLLVATCLGGYAFGRLSGWPVAPVVPAAR
jgi:hypothetical protein